MILLTPANEKSTYIVTVAFTDEDGNSVVPNSVTWTLSDMVGNVINSRTSVVVTPAASVDILLSGDDLKITSSTDNAIRRLTVEILYNSSLGTNLPGKQEYTFRVVNLVNVS